MTTFKQFYNESAPLEKACAACEKELGIKSLSSSNKSHSLCKRHMYEYYKDVLGPEKIKELLSAPDEEFPPDLSKSNIKESIENIPLLQPGDYVYLKPNYLIYDIELKIKKDTKDISPLKVVSPFRDGKIIGEYNGSYYTVGESIDWELTSLLHKQNVQDILDI